MRKQHYLLTIISTFILMVMCSVNMIGQETRGAIKRFGLDPNNAPIPGAKVVVSDPSRGTQVSTISNNEGFYQVSYLLSGNILFQWKPMDLRNYKENILIEIGNTIQWIYPWRLAVHRNCNRDL